MTFPMANPKAIPNDNSKCNVTIPNALTNILKITQDKNDNIANEIFETTRTKRFLELPQISSGS
jgi:hypothetical protein